MNNFNFYEKLLDAVFSMLSHCSFAIYRIYKKGLLNIQASKSNKRNEVNETRSEILKRRLFDLIQIQDVLKKHFY